MATDFVVRGWDAVAGLAQTIDAWTGLPWTAPASLLSASYLGLILGVVLPWSLLVSLWVSTWVRNVAGIRRRPRSHAAAYKCPSVRKPSVELLRSQVASRSRRNTITSNLRPLQQGAQGSGLAGSAGTSGEDAASGLGIAQVEAAAAAAAEAVAARDAAGGGRDGGGPSAVVSPAGSPGSHPAGHSSGFPSSSAVSSVVSSAVVSSDEDASDSDVETVVSSMGGGAMGGSAAAVSAPIEAPGRSDGAASSWQAGPGTGPGMGPGMASKSLPGSPRPRSKAGVRLTRFSGLQQSSVQIDVVPDAQIEMTELLSKVRMTWENEPQAVLVVKRWLSEDVSIKTVRLITHLLDRYEVDVYVEPDVKDSDYADWPRVYALPVEDAIDVASVVDVVICMGGDGTLLHATTFFAKSVPPILSFSLGSLGFLTPFSFVRFKEVISMAFSGGFHLTLRSRLVCSIVNGSTLRSSSSIGLNDPSSDAVVQFQVLNDMVVDRGPTASLAALDIFCDADFITSVQADGLIIATATGSTAYSMSAGGSIVHPGVPCILLTPICPHSVSFRPIIFPYSSTIRIRLSANARNTAWVSFDGRSRTELTRDQTLLCHVSPWSVPTISKVSETADWLLSLRRNMHWNKRTTQKPLKS